MNEETDSKGMVEYAWSHGIISDKLYHNIMTECSFTPDSNSTNQTPTHCEEHARGFALAYSDIDIYSIYSPICLSSSSSSSGFTFSTLLALPPRIFSIHVSSSLLILTFFLLHLKLHSSFC